MRVILAGGGTGGHVIPGLAIARELKAQHGAEVVFVGTARGIETRLVPAAGFALKLIKVGKLNQVSLLTRLKTGIGLPFAVLNSWKILREFRPDVVIGVGGYASGPVMLAAAKTGVPTLAFSPDRIPGFTNRILAKMVNAAAVQFQETCKWFPNCRVTGVPVRAEFFKLPPRDPTAAPTLLLFGGSRGAHALNMALVAALPLLRERMPGLHIIHQTGEADYQEVQAAYLREAVSAEVSPFIDDMPSAFAHADLLFCRSGASTIAEITASGKPAIFVPLPTAADDHQRHNADALTSKGAALMIPQGELTKERLADAVAGVLGKPDQLRAMGAEAKTLAHPDAAREIAELAVSLTKK